MLSYALKRIIGAVPTLALLMTIVFFALRLAPGGPFDGERKLPPEIEFNIQVRYGLNRPLYAQFGTWVKDVVQGDLGESFQYVGKPVIEIITQTLPVSLTLGFWALIIALLLGIPLGVLAAAKRATLWDSSAMFFAVSGVSLPSYLTASALILVFSLRLGWLPPALWEDWRSAILPILTLGLRPLAVIARLVRSSLIDSLHADYIRTAYAKGLRERTVLFKHALKNSLLPVITLLGPLAANLVTGSFLVEVVFQIPGLGKHFVNAVLNRDYPLVMGVTLVYGAILLGANIIVDVLNAWIDPRIRLEEA